MLFCTALFLLQVEVIAPVIQSLATVGSTFLGPVLRESIVRWVKKQTSPAAISVTTEEELKIAEEQNEVLVLGYFKKFVVSIKILLP